MLPQWRRKHAVAVEHDLSEVVLQRIRIQMPEGCIDNTNTQSKIQQKTGEQTRVKTQSGIKQQNQRIVQRIVQRTDKGSRPDVFKRFPHEADFFFFANLHPLKWYILYIILSKNMCLLSSFCYFPPVLSLQFLVWHTPQFEYLCSRHIQG